MNVSSMVCAILVVVAFVGCSAETVSLERSHSSHTSNDSTNDSTPSLLDAPGDPPLGETAAGDSASAHQGIAASGALGAATTPEPVGCNDLEFGVSDFGPFSPDSVLPVRGESDAEVNIFRSGYIHTSLDYGALRRYADPSYCSPYAIDCTPSSNTQRFRTLRIAAGLGAARVIRFALWATSRTQLQYRQVSMNAPGASPGARDVPVGGTGPYTFELRNLLTQAVLTSIATDEIDSYMLTAYVPDASQTDAYRNRVCALRVDVSGKVFGD
jgi:hypothetical protein